jgi:thioester reductase-like protein
VPVIGDLGAPRLGLSEPDFDTLAAMIDVVYHNGAFVNYTYPYSVLKGPNVLGTQEVLRLVSRTRIKPLHFVSTLGVFEGVGGTEALEIMEHDTLDRVDGIQLGYAQSKWVAEKLLMCARERGLPISVYRPGRVSGDSANGACQSNDFLWRLAKICIQMGLVPDVHTTVNVVPVDYVSRSIVHLSQTPMARDKAFHIVSPVSTRFTDLVDWMRAYGYRLTTVPHDVWLDQLREVAQDSAELAIFSLLLGAPSGEARIEPTFDWRNTRAGLADTAISCPHIDARLFAIYCDYFVRTGFLPAPNESAS